jgi:uncharacterized protein (TIGR03790 family)
MSRAALLLFCALLAIGFAESGREKKSPEVSPYAAQTVVVYNEADPDSGDLARYYLRKRGIPKDNLVGLKCPKTEEISRAEYDETIATPLRETFVKKGWWTLRDGESPAGKVETTKIHFVALIRGVPLKIKQQFEPYEGDKPAGPPPIATHNEASVDSELAVLGVYTRQISGALSNPYFRSYERISDTHWASLLLVCRLDAPAPEMVRRMIDDSLAAESAGLRGMAYIDGRGTKDAGLAEGDKWIFGAGDVARRKGLPVVVDNGEGLFPRAYPMTHTAIYFGWYAENVTGPFVRPDFRFERGAIAAHLHSFSASTLRDPRKYWCGPLIAAGAAATIGNVYEPYLGLTTNFEIVMDRLRSGFTFGESCYMGQRFVSWMPTFIGDPLYRPFANADLPLDATPKNEWEAFQIGVRTWFDRGAEEGTAKLKAGAQKFSSGMMMEGLGLLQLSANDGANAVTSFEQAAKLYRTPADSVRATIHEVFQLKALNRSGDAIAVARKALARYNKEPTADVLRGLEAELTFASGSSPHDVSH